MTDFQKPDFSNSNVDYDLPRISISQIIGMIEEPFDKERVLELTYNKHFNNPDSQYYQKTKEEIAAMWEAKGAESRKYGCLLDDYIGANLTSLSNAVEQYKAENDFDNDKRLQGLCESFDNFYNVLSKSGDTVFVDREKSVYHKVKLQDPNDPAKEIEYNIKGRFDALFYNKRTKKWIVIDWKSSGTIDKIPNRWTKNLLGPMSKFPALNYWTYTTQLYFYKKTLVEDGYLPAGTSVDNVVVMIVNLPGKKIEELGTNFGTHGPAYQYDTMLLNNLFEYAVKKDYAERLIEEAKKLQEASKQAEEQQNLLDSIF